MCHVDVGAIFKHYAFFFEQMQSAVYDLLVEFEVGYAVAEQSACRFVAVVHRHAVALEVQTVGGDQSCRSGAYHGDTFAVAFGVVYAYVVFGKGVLGDGSLVFAVGGRLVFHEV